LNGKKVLITGGTGFVGQNLIDRMIKKNVKEVRIFSRDEKKQNDLRQRYKDDRLKFYIGDIRNEESIRNALYNIDVIIHTASLNKVPTCEFFPLEAVKTNCLGFENVIDASIKQNVDDILVLSSSKSVYPINAVGISKALMEKIALAKVRDFDGYGPRIVIIRSPNSIEAEGGVLRILNDNIKKGNNLRITDRSMTRFFVKIEEILDLIDIAYNKGHSGDIYAVKTKAYNLEDLANSILKVHRSNNTINEIGTRLGEKRTETIISKEERLVVSEYDKYYVIPIDKRGLNYDKYFSNGDTALSKSKEISTENVDLLNLEELTQEIHKIITGL